MRTMTRTGEQLQLLGMTRTGDLDTAESAAVIALTSVADGRQKALDALASVYPDGLSDFDLADITGTQQTSIGKRRGELVDAGFVERHRDEFGQWARHTTPTGSPCSVWSLTDTGITAWRNGTPIPAPPRQHRRPTTKDTDT